MSTRNSSKSSLFLIELIIAILFFSIGSAVCVRAFVKAHSLSTDAKDLSFASAQVSSMASVLKYTDRSLASIREYFPDAAGSDEEFLVFYDEERTPCGEADAVFTMHAEMSEASGMIYAQIFMEREGDDPLYELKLRFVPQTGGEEAQEDES